MRTRVLEHLAALVGADTSDPPATVRADNAALVYAASVLEGCDFRTEITDLGGGRVYVVASRGAPRLLMSCHFDTVAADPAWTRDPFALSVEGERAYGLGACDIKGGGAAMLAAAEATDRNVAFIFNTDEEGGHGICVGHFLGRGVIEPAAVVVAEPTGMRALKRHRGFASCSVTFKGEASHTSGAAAAERSAAHAAIRWGHAALALTRPGGILEHARFNIGVVEGGTAWNVTASRVTMSYGFRPRPGDDPAAMTEALRACVPSGAELEWSDEKTAPALPSLADTPPVEPLLEHWGIEPGPDADYWTEAAMFGAAGLPAFVLGPGHIAQAHQADEFVELSQLDAAAATFAAVIAAGLPGEADAP